MEKKDTKKIDWMITCIPVAIVVALGILFFVVPEESNVVLGKIRFAFGDTAGTYYLVIGLGIFITTLVLAVSKYGNIVLGNKDEKPKYSFFAWGSMMFSCGIAADILYYSFSEWMFYEMEPHVAELGGDIHEWSTVFPVYHWSLIPWSFYLMLAVAFGFMLHVRKKDRQKFSEACRPVLGKHTDGILGRIIDLFAVFALVAGTATTFSIATPFMARVFNEVFHVDLNVSMVTIAILLITCFIYTYSLLHGFKGISILANACVYMFFGILIYVLLFGGEAKFIIDTGVQSIGKMIQNFIGLSTYTDPMRNTSFPQTWTIFYWAYWMVWCVATPFFIGNVSRGRTIRQVIFGGYLFGAGSTLLSFVVLGDYSLAKQLSGAADFIGTYQQTGDIHGVMIDMINSLPFAVIVLVLVLLTMIAFYATSFDSIAYIASCYSYKKLGENESPNKLIELLWCVLLIIIPIGLVFSESSTTNMQSVSIIAAFPIAAIILLITVSFFKDAKKYLSEK